MEILAIQKKLRMDKAKSFLVLDIPDSLKALLPHSGVDQAFSPQSGRIYEYILLFSKVQEDLEEKIIQVKKAGKQDCLFWVAYPKLTGSIPSNLKRETVWNAFAMIGLKAVTQIAINETWSALRARPIKNILVP
jgi:hypothetical protein